MIDIEVTLVDDEVVEVQLTETNVEVEISPAAELTVEVVGSGPPGRDGTGLPEGGSIGDIVMKTAAGDAWVTPANAAEQDNTLPITSAGVYLEIGNINAILATI